MRTASRRNSSVYLGAIPYLLHSKHCSKETGTKTGQDQIDGMDDKIISLYAAGLSTRNIRARLEGVYDLKVSADLISRVTDAVLEEVSDWQNRALEPMYSIVFLAGKLLPTW